MNQPSVGRRSVSPPKMQRILSTIAPRRDARKNPLHFDQVLGRENGNYIPEADMNNAGKDARLPASGNGEGLAQMQTFRETPGLLSRYQFSKPLFRITCVSESSQSLLLKRSEYASHPG